MLTVQCHVLNQKTPVSLHHSHAHGSHLHVAAWLTKWGCWSHQMGCSGATSPAVWKPVCLTPDLWPWPLNFDLEARFATKSRASRPYRALRDRLSARLGPARPRALRATLALRPAAPSDKTTIFASRMRSLNGKGYRKTSRTKFVGYLEVIWVGRFFSQYIRKSRR
jgi:hypothetical protein